MLYEMLDHGFRICEIIFVLLNRMSQACEMEFVLFDRRL